MATTPGMSLSLNLKRHNRVVRRLKLNARFVVLAAYGLAQNAACTLRLGRALLCEVTAESFSVERHGTGARNNFDIFELQWLATR
jgi:hypothetical protein